MAFENVVVEDDFVAESTEPGGFAGDVAGGAADDFTGVGVSDGDGGGEGCEGEQGCAEEVGELHFGGGAGFIGGLVGFLW